MIQQRYIIILLKNYMVIKKDHKYENTTQIFNKENNSIIENSKFNNIL